MIKFFLKMLDNNYAEKYYQSHNKLNDNSIDWSRVIPFIIIHTGALGVFFVTFDWMLVWLAVSLFVIRMFAITGFYHRYFSHKTFKTSRVIQFIFAYIGATSAQRGPIWWASHHRRHHKNSDQIEDHHSPHVHNFLWSHMGWFLAKKNFLTNKTYVKDLLKFKELVLIDRFDWFPPLSLIAALFLLGSFFPLFIDVGVIPTIVWGFFLSTVLVYHCTFAVNSIAHIWGKQRYVTNEKSKNNFWIALLTFGEGWHNNHHHYPGSIRQGFFWWEIDFTYYVLKLLSLFGIVHNFRTVSDTIKLKQK